jgi:hypothetical protein
VIAARLADPDLYRDAAAAAHVAASFSAAQEAVEALYRRWSDLEERKSG